MDIEKIRDDKSFLFISLSIGNIRIKGANQGVAYLIPILKRYGYTVHFIDLSSDISKESFLEKIRSINPGIIGFSSTTQEYKYLIHFSNILRKESDIMQIAGGVHPSLDPIDVLRRTSVDGVCIGEGEIPLEELLVNIQDNKDITKTRGFYWRTGKKMIKNDIPPFIKDISTIEFPDFSHYPRDIVIKKWDPNRNLVIEKTDELNYFTIVLSRGCPYRCTYCCNQAKAEIYKGQKGYHRLPTVEYSISFLKKMIKNYPETDYIEFIDDLLITNQEWFLEFIHRYHKTIGLPYKINGRFENINTKIVNAFIETGCTQVFFGLESGDEEYRNNILNRRHSNKLIIEKAKMIKDADIQLMTMNMVGLPTDFGSVVFYRPYKGSKLYDMSKEMGLLKSGEDMIQIVSNFDRPFVKSTNMSEFETITYQKLLTFFFFSRAAENRIGKFISKRKGLGKLLVVKALIRIFLIGIKMYYIDYIKEKRKKED